jgi:hypothetical protein
MDPIRRRLVRLAPRRARLRSPWNRSARSPGVASEAVPATSCSAMRTVTTAGLGRELRCTDRLVARAEEVRRLRVGPQIARAAVSLRAHLGVDLLGLRARNETLEGGRTQKLTRGHHRDPTCRSGTALAVSSSATRSTRKRSRAKSATSTNCSPTAPLPVWTRAFSSTPRSPGAECPPRRPQRAAAARRDRRRDGTARPGSRAVPHARSRNRIDCDDGHGRVACA